ncbi:MAG: CarD family transcriptional regulator [Lachnospiraceae bacterium]|nr:CarD family transcriptional regulator [Lachnospiraceae bacterium]
MFNIGEYIVYGNRGVCEVTDVSKMSMSAMDKDKLYYTLVPIYAKGSKIYSPVDNTKVIIRPVITHDEAIELINNIPDIGYVEDVDEKKREMVYKDAIRTGKCEELIKVIKTLNKRREIRLAGGKKFTAVDERYFNSARDCLYGELAVALDIPVDDVEGYIAERIEK